MDIQDLIEGMSARLQRERARTQMTLGKLIDLLDEMPLGSEVENLHGAHSYRGYYQDLAFERSNGMRLAVELLAECRDAMGRVFTGYKGGDYMMGALTPVWISSYGCCGEKIISLSDCGKFETTEDD